MSRADGSRNGARPRRRPACTCSSTTDAPPVRRSRTRRAARRARLRARRGSRESASASAPMRPAPMGGNLLADLLQEEVRLKPARGRREATRRSCSRRTRRHPLPANDRPRGPGDELRGRGPLCSPALPRRPCPRLNRRFGRPPALNLWCAHGATPAPSATAGGSTCTVPRRAAGLELGTGVDVNPVAPQSAPLAELRDA